MGDLAELLRVLPTAPLDAGPVNGLGDLDFLQVTVAGTHAASTWRSLCEAVEETRRWPVIIGGRASLDDFRKWVASRFEGANEAQGKSLGYRHEVMQVLQQSEVTPFEEWLENHRDPAWRAADYLRKAEHIEKFPGSESLAGLFRRFAADYAAAKPEQFDPSACEWPDEEMKRVTNLAVLYDHAAPRFEELFAEAVILLLPTAVGWEAPAYLSFGGFNACPPPEVHVAMAKWGYHRYGAQVVAISRDTIELECARPPATREGALLLARDLRLYAEEVTVDARILGNLASALKNGSIWSCWWD